MAVDDIETAAPGSAINSDNNPCRGRVLVQQSPLYLRQLGLESERHLRIGSACVPGVSPDAGVGGHPFAHGNGGDMSILNRHAVKRVVGGDVDLTAVGRKIERRSFGYEITCGAAVVGKVLHVGCNRGMVVVEHVNPERLSGMPDGRTFGIYVVDGANQYQRRLVHGFRIIGVMASGKQ